MTREEYFETWETVILRLIVRKYQKNLKLFLSSYESDKDKVFRMLCRGMKIIPYDFKEQLEKLYQKGKKAWGVGFG